MKKDGPATTTIEHDLERYEQDEMFWEISWSDVVKLPEYKSWAKDKWDGRENEHRVQTGYMTIGYPAPDQDTLDKLLFSLGMDTQQSVEIQENTHRNFAGDIVNCPRFVGCQRNDNQWVGFKKNLNMYKNK